MNVWGVGYSARRGGVAPAPRAAPPGRNAPLTGIRSLRTWVGAEWPGWSRSPARRSADCSRTRSPTAIDANAGHAGPLHSGHHHHGDAAVSAAAGTSHWTLCFALCGSLGLVAVIAAALHHVGAGRSARLPLWLFGLVPPVGFALQAHLEWPIRARLRAVRRRPGRVAPPRRPAPDPVRARRLRRGACAPGARRVDRPRAACAAAASTCPARAVASTESGPYTASALPPRARLRPAWASARRALATKRNPTKEDT